MPKFFKKEIPETPLYLSVGKPLNFEFVDINGFGYLATDDGFIIKELYTCISRGTGGVTEISEDEWLLFQAQKKTGSSISGSRRQRPTIGPNGNSLQNQRSAAEAAVADTGPSVVGVSRNGDLVSGKAQFQKPESLAVTKEFVKPRVGRIEMPQ